METKQAVYPRIILDAQTVELIDEIMSNNKVFSRLIRTDKDGCKYLNILYPILKENKNIKSILSDLIQKELIEYSDSQSTVQKLTWLGNEYGL